MTQLYFDTSPGPGTHVLVIGAGNYEPSNWGLLNLDSAVHSANGVIDWLLSEARQPTAMAAPLKSIEVLISSPAGPVQCNDAEGNLVPLATATMENLKAAVQRWFNLGNMDLANQLIFYFCGHGLQKGLQKYLLLEGFGNPAAMSVVDDAIDFDSFVLGMERCQARRQVYFLDCCRSIQSKALNIQASLGKAIIDPDHSQIVSTLPRDWPVFCASASGTPAFGANGQISRFTAALLKALKGCAWNHKRQVTTDALATHIDKLLKFEERIRFVPQQFAKRSGESVDIPLFTGLPDRLPISLPVLISCQDEAQLPTTSFTVTGGTLAVPLQRPASNIAWELYLPTGASYRLDADNNGNAKSLDFGVFPACEFVEI